MLKSVAWKIRKDQAFIDIVEVDAGRLASTGRGLSQTRLAKEMIYEA